MQVGRKLFVPGDCVKSVTFQQHPEKACGEGGQLKQLSF